VISRSHTSGLDQGRSKLLIKDKVDWLLKTPSCPIVLRLFAPILLLLHRYFFVELVLELNRFGFVAYEVLLPVRFLRIALRRWSPQAHHLARLTLDLRLGLRRVLVVVGVEGEELPLRWRHCILIQVETGEFSSHFVELV